jgi:hypothetical protein
VSPLSATSVRLLIASTAVVFGCGGKVVFVEDDGAEPQGGSPVGPGPSNGGSPPQVTGGAGDGGSIGVGVPMTDCQLACNTVFQCGLQPDGNGIVLCPGFQPGDQTEFVAGCVSTCEKNMALVAIVDPDDCEATIETLEAVNAEFDDICSFGF